MSDKKRYQARIAGKDYTILGSESDDHMDAVVALVNDQLDQLSKLAPELSLIDRSILMAVNAISDQLKKEAELKALQESAQDAGRPDSRPATSQAPINRVQAKKVDG